MNDKKIISNLKSLALDMIYNAGSGHPGIVLGSAPIIYSLYAYHLKFKANDPTWINRDRFILSAGHASALLYANLFMCGYDYKIEDLKRFRRIDSITPGHPKYNPKLGIEMTTGPLGQGVATAIGIALGEKIYYQKIAEIDKKCDLIDYYTFVLCSDGDLMEGVSYEACSFAGQKKLGKLILLYDSNDITLDGKNQNIDNIEQRFKAMQWHYQKVKNANDIKTLNKAIIKAKREVNRPSIIEIKSVLGAGSLYENTNKIHGNLNKEDYEHLKKILKVKNLAFNISDAAVRNYQSFVSNRVENDYNKWQNIFKKCSNDKRYKKILKILNNNIFDLEFDSDKIKLDGIFAQELRKMNNKIINIIASKSEYFYGGSADLATSCCTTIEIKERNINFGVREHAMGAILNGMALTNLRIFGSTFLVFCDYMKPAIRLAAMMQLPVIYIFTHDSINIGQDGETHQPIEQLTALRCIPNFNVYRPADIKEIIGSWENILNKKQPSALIISKQVLPIISTNAKSVKYGAYIIRKEIEKLDGVIIATGSEVHLALKVAEKLYLENIDVRVVSMVCQELFNKTSKSYQETILPVGSKIITLEAADSFSWYQYTYKKENIIALDDFGASGTSDEVLNKYNFNFEKVYDKVKKILK